MIPTTDSEVHSLFITCSGFFPQRNTVFNIFIWYFGTYPAYFGITVLIKMVFRWGGLVLLMKQNNLMNSYCGFAGIKIVTLTLQHLWVFVEILIPTCNIIYASWCELTHECVYLKIKTLFISFIWNSLPYPVGFDIIVLISIIICFSWHRPFLLELHKKECIILEYYNCILLEFIK